MCCHSIRITHLKASMTTLPFTDWMGSTTTATALWFSASKLCAQPITISAHFQMTESARMGQSFH